MKTEKAILREKANQYGLAAMTDNELIKLTGYKGPDFWASQEFKYMKELTRREQVKDKIKISSSRDAYNHLKFLEDYDHEEFFVIYLSRANHIIEIKNISKGCQSACVVNIQAIVREALNLKKCTALILCHNHPSGQVNPSDADRKITKQVKDAANLFDINTIDHIIIGKGVYYSFADEGLI